ncbi:MAG: hypothetical protein ACFB22_06090 [Rhodothalassiaceae bacterium]
MAGVPPDGLPPALPPAATADPQPVAPAQADAEAAATPTATQPPPASVPDASGPDASVAETRPEAQRPDVPGPEAQRPEVSRPEVPVELQLSAAAELVGTQVDTLLLSRTAQTLTVQTEAGLLQLDQAPPAFRPGDQLVMVLSAQDRPLSVTVLSRNGEPLSPPEVLPVLAVGADVAPAPATSGSAPPLPPAAAALLPLLTRPEILAAARAAVLLVPTAAPSPPLGAAVAANVASPVTASAAASPPGAVPAPAILALPALATHQLAAGAGQQLPGDAPQGPPQQAATPPILSLAALRAPLLQAGETAPPAGAAPAITAGLPQPPATSASIFALSQAERETLRTVSAQATPPQAAASPALAPFADGAVLPPGSTVALRFTAQAPAVVLHTSVQPQAAAIPILVSGPPFAPLDPSFPVSQPVLTPFGPARLDVPHALPDGQALLLVPPTPATAAGAGADPLPAAPLPDPPRSWPAAAAIGQALVGTPADTGATPAGSTGAPAPQIPALLALLLGGLRRGQPPEWLGEAARDQLGRLGREPLMRQFDEEAARLFMAGRSGESSEWRAFALPLLQDGQPHPILLLHKPLDEEAGAEADPDTQSRGARFLVDVRFATLGPMQLEGLWRPPRLDLLLRTETRLPEPMERDLDRIATRILARAERPGDLRFVVEKPFPVDAASQFSGPQAPFGTVA